MNPKRRRYTWVSLDMNTRNQIDCILIGRRFRNDIKSSKSYPGADCGSDHILVEAKLHSKLRKLQTPKQVVKYQLDKLAKTTTLERSSTLMYLIDTRHWKIKTYQIYMKIGTHLRGS